MRAQWGGADIGDGEGAVGPTGEADVDDEMDVEWTLDSDEEEIEREGLRGHCIFGDG